MRDTSKAAHILFAEKLAAWPGKDVKKAPRYAKKGKKGKKLMPQPYDEQLKPLKPLQKDAGIPAELATGLGATASAIPTAMGMYQGAKAQILAAILGGGGGAYAGNRPAKYLLPGAPDKAKQQQAQEQSEEDMTTETMAAP